ncbi:HD-domain/PDEase-like protein, partial [Patellaria atrata CBS 101060]
MDHGACNVIYLDKRAKEALVRKDSASTLVSGSPQSSTLEGSGYFNSGKTQSEELQSNIDMILSLFNEVHVFGSGSSCLSKITQLHDTASDLTPTIVLIDVPYDEEQRLKRLSREPRTHSPVSSRKPTLTDSGELDDLYGLHLLLHVSSEIQQRNLSKLVVPIVILSGFDRGWAIPTSPSPGLYGSQASGDTVRIVRYLDAGAVDVLTSPLSKDHVQGLAVHAYRVWKEASREDSSFLATKRKRKLSWVGVDDSKPYAYLREAMVSNLMTGICNPETVGESLDPNDIEVTPERKAAVARAVGTWEFSAHDYTDDELLYGALLMLQHALRMPELEKWRLGEGDLIIFLMSSRMAYNEFVLYHNFRHVTDVLQALFFFLVSIGSLPPYPDGSSPVKRSSSAIATLLKPFEALTLLISAIGHDVGHPGVNNAFLVALNSPLAQLYNDRSVLESFHCAAYSQILRRYWPSVFADADMRKLMINSILATDMGLHFKYMTDLGNLQSKLAHNGNVLDGFNLKQLEEYKDLTCGLLIKCADICNVARKFDTAAQWASILTDEFSNQGAMEEALNMKSCLFGGPPIRDNIIKMGESQIGFMNIFARPLFEAITQILPAMHFSIEEIIRNKNIWESKIDTEKERKSKMLGHFLGTDFHHDGQPSPMSSQPDLTKRDAGKSHSDPMPVIEVPIHPLSQVAGSEQSSRRSSLGSPAQFHPAASSSRRSSLGQPTSTDMTSRRSSAAAKRGSVDGNNQSRRGSADASITAILVTRNSGPSDKKKKEKN